MASGEQQLQADFALVKKLLSDYPSIKLVATKGDPPEQYDIEYTIKGYRAHPDGTVLPANKHQVRITLPFGYPLFAPTAKPLTPIFHPDIDPDAIRIADFWKKNKSLPDLIIHIGEMICGTFYSADPFNQRAYDWFEERKSWMPFDILEPHEGEEEEGPFVARGPAAGVAASTAAPTAPTGEAGGPAREAEEISLDFAGEGESGLPGEEESAELGDLLDGEFSYAFDVEEQAGAPTEGGTAADDLTALQDEIQLPDLGLELEQTETAVSFEDLTGDQDESALAFEPEKGGGSVDLTGLQEESAPLDFGLKPEQEPSPAPGLTGGAETDFTAGFHLAEEPLHQDESIELGDLAAVGTLDFSGLESLPALPAEEFESIAPGPAPATDHALDFGIAEAEQIPEAGPVPVAPAPEGEGGLLSGIALQLDDDHGTQFGSQVRPIRPLIDKKEIFTAKRVLADIQDLRSVPDREELELTIAAAISEAEELFKKADALEQKGELEKAGLLLDLVANIATDYPGLEFARNRIREAVMAGGQKKGGETGTGEEDAAAAEQPLSLKRGGAKLAVSIPYRFLGTVLAFAALAGGGTLLYFRDSASLATARTELGRGQQLVEKKDFKEAEKAFNAARSELDTILLLQWAGKKETAQAIDVIVNGQPFKEGLQGRVLYNGQYVTLEAAKAIDRYNLHAGAAQHARQAGNIEQAMASYEKSLEYAEKAGFQDKIQEIRQNISTLRLQQAITQAREAEEDQEWKKAAETYQKALELSSSLASPEERGEIAQHLAAAALRHELDESRRAFTASEWQKTVEMLERAQKIITDNPTLVSEAEKVEISKLMINANVYQILSDAKKAFVQQNWDGAVKEYDRAIALLRQQEGVLGQEEVRDGVGKIEKTVLMTRISREQQHIESGATSSSALQANLEHYKTIVALIEKSPQKEDAVLREILDNARTQTVAMEKEILVASKMEYLKNNYETIFRDNYPSARSSVLSNPQITFAKREGNILVFSMRCAEKSQGRNFRLELNYQYDLDKNAWSIYSGKL